LDYLGKRSIEGKKVLYGEMGKKFLEISRWGRVNGVKKCFFFVGEFKMFFRKKKILGKIFWRKEEKYHNSQ
jgi:hypothetical protein